MDTIENVMYELRPPMLDDHGLAAGAPPAEIAPNQDNGDCVMSVLDDGIGFDVGENA
jgi:signal transduction histidine kinase